MTRVVLLLLIIVGGVYGQNPVTAIPVLQEGRRVYTIPADFIPPGIGQHGMNDIEAASKKLHYPFYVVFVKELPGRGDAQQIMADLIDRIANQWQQQASFDAQRTQIFVKSYAPHRYALLAGSDFRTRLNFVREKQKPYTDVFEKYVKSNTPDVKGGLFALMPKVDTYLFENTDLKQIAQRERAIQQQQEADVFEQLKKTLDSDIDRLEQLLKQKNFLPDDVASYQEALEEAKKMRGIGTREALGRYVPAFSNTVNALDTEVSARRSTRQWQIAMTLVALLGGIVGIVIAATTLYGRYLRTEQLRDAFLKRCAEWQKKIDTAMQGYVNYYLQREEVLRMVGDKSGKNLQGETAKLYTSVTENIDNIYVGVTALQRHLDECAEDAKQASFWSHTPLRKADEKLTQPFTVEKNEIDSKNLFAPQIQVTTINPITLFKDLEGRYEETTEGWNRLKAAAELRFSNTENPISHNGLQRLLRDLDDADISRSWLQSHPLALLNEDASQVEEELIQLKTVDPVGCLIRIDEIMDKEVSLYDIIERVIAAKKNVEKATIAQRPDVNGVVDPGDDPRIAFDEARLRHREFEVLLREGNDIAALEAKATSVINEYDDCQFKSQQLAAAHEGLAEYLETLVAKEATALSAQKQATAQAQRASKIHSNVRAEDYLAKITLFLDKGRAEQQRAVAHYQEQKWINASKRAESADSHFDEALKACEEVERRCAALDREKTQYEKLIAGSERKRKAYQEVINKKGIGNSKKTLNPYQEKRGDGPQDYSLLIVDYTNHESSWQGSVSQAEASATAWAGTSYGSSSSSPSSSGSSSDSGGGSCGGGSSCGGGGCGGCGGG